jgi:hypothetical protein
MKLDDIGKHLLRASAAGLLALPAIAMADHHDTMEVTAEAALEVDILLAIDLPLVAHEARESGIPEQEIEVALTSAMNAGLSAGTATEVVAVEVEETRSRGEPRDNFGQWVRRRVADGVTGRELAQSIRDRKAELEDLSEEQERELDEKLEQLRERHRAHRAQLREKRKALREEGKAIALRGKSEHEARKQALIAARADLVAASKSLAAGGRGVSRGRPEAPGASRGGSDIKAGAGTPAASDAPERPDADAKASASDAKASAADAKARAADAKASAADAKASAADAAKAKSDAAKAKSDAAKAKSDAAQAKSDAAKAKSDAKASAADAKAR